MRVDGKVAIVTGGAGGIGSAAARALAREGAAVAVLDREETSGRALAEAIAGDGDRATFARVDVTREPDVMNAVAGVEAQWGRVDVLFNNAGIMDLEQDGPVDRLDVEVWDRILRVNLTGAFIVAKHVVPAMRRSGGGSIINTASAVALAGASRYAAYVASKGGVVSLTRSMAAIHGRDGIRVNAICPGIVDTDLVGDMFPTEDARRRAIDWHILRRFGTPEDIAGLIVYLASDESSWMTGAILPIDGGATAR